MLLESVRVLRGSEDKFCLAYGIFGLAAVAAAREEPVRAARLWGAAEARGDRRRFPNAVGA